MKTKDIKIDGKTYQVRELTMEEGMPLLTGASGQPDMAAMIRVSTKIDGKPAKEGDITMSVAMKLLPLVNELNTFVAAEGNG